MVKPILILQIAAMGILFFACSHGSTNISTPLTPDNESTFPIFENNANSENHVLLGTWDLEFNLDNLTAQITPNRIIEAHYNVTSLVPSPEITINSYDPITNIVDVDVALTNPYQVDGFDVRLIIYTDSIGHMLRNADSWTSLFDIPGGYPINPFKAYAKSEQNRRFRAQTESTENLLIFLPNGNRLVSFAVDASYPDNCAEPYEITDFTHGVLRDRVNASTTVTVNVQDWQNDTSDVFLHCPGINDEILIAFERTEIAITWRTRLINSLGAQEGVYQGWVMAVSQDNYSQAIYQSISVNVTRATEKNWAITFGGVEQDWCYDVKVNDNSIYATGEWSSSVDFDPGEGEEWHVSNDSWDAFLCKYDENLNLVWVKTWGGTDADWGSAISFNNLDEIFIGGGFYGVGDFDPGLGVDQKESKGGSDCFLSKYDEDGNYYWTKTWGGVKNDQIGDLSLDDVGNIYANGNFRDAVDFDPGPSVIERTSNGGRDGYILKLDKDGNFQWVATVGGTGYDVCIRTLYLDNYLYAIGEYSGSVDFDPSPDNDEIRISNGSVDAYLCKFDSTNCGLVYVKTWGGIEGDSPDGITCENSNNIYIAGSFTNTVDFDPGPDTIEFSSNGDSDAFLSKFDVDGDFKYAKVWGGIGLDTCNNLLYDSGSIYTIGFFEETVDFDPGPGISESQSNGYGDFYLSKFNTSGDFEWVRTWGGSDNECSSGLTSKENGDVLIGGQFNSECVDFDPGPEEYFLYVTPGETFPYDVFILEVNPSGYWE